MVIVLVVTQLKNIKKVGKEKIRGKEVDFAGERF